MRVPSRAMLPAALALAAAGAAAADGHQIPILGAPAPNVTSSPIDHRCLAAPPMGDYLYCAAYLGGNVLVSHQFGAIDHQTPTLEIQLLACIDRGWVGFGVGNPDSPGMSNSALLVGFLSSNETSQGDPCLLSVWTDNATTGGRWRYNQYDGPIKILKYHVESQNGWLNVTATVSRNFNCSYFGANWSNCALGGWSSPLKALVAFRAQMHGDPNCRPDRYETILGHLPGDRVLVPAGQFPWNGPGNASNNSDEAEQHGARGNCSFAPETASPTATPVPTVQPAPPPGSGGGGDHKSVLIIGIVLFVSAIVIVLVSVLVWFKVCKRYGLYRRLRFARTMQTLDGDSE